MDGEQHLAGSLCPGRSYRPHQGSRQGSRNELSSIQHKLTVSPIAVARHIDSQQRFECGRDGPQPDSPGFGAALFNSSKNASPYRSSFSGPTPETARSSSGVAGSASAMARRVLSLKTM